MLSPSDFTLKFVEPSVKQFSNDPTSLVHACTALWCLDALASHVALAQSPKEIGRNASARSVEEVRFKSSRIESGQPGAWQFHVVREASNALKHGWRKKTTPRMEASDCLYVENLSGSLWYFHGPERAPRWGRQVVCKLDIIFDERERCFHDTYGRKFKGPFTTWVPILGLLTPKLSLLGVDCTKVKQMIGSDWPRRI